MQENRCKVDEERKELQRPCIGHFPSGKTPVSNLKMVTDTLLTKPVTEQERTEFCRNPQSQTDKLDFLFQALVKPPAWKPGQLC